MELHETQKVQVSKIGTDGNLSVVGSFQIIQDAVTDLLCLYDLDAPTLRDKHNAIWLFVKTRAKFIKKLECQEVFTVNAFVSYVSLAKMHVDVQIKNAHGETALYSRTVLCALDREKQSIRRLPTVGVNMNMPTRGEEIKIDFTDFVKTDLPLIDTVRVNSTNIDMSHHTNNVEYVRLIMNTYSVEQTESMNIRDMELIYTDQSYENDSLAVRKAVIDNTHYIVLEKIGSPVIKCEIVCEK
ncbi:MAG: hypothetical protein HDT28_01125 [Clostridiales bacterium]|nr:hypothetical protein [Clostridiales bacterium]